MSSSSSSPLCLSRSSLAHDSADRIPSRDVECTVLVGHTDKIRSAAFSPDGSLVATASRDATVRLWKVANGECVAILPSRRHVVGVHCAVFSPDGSRIITGGSDNTGRLWHTSSGECIAVLPGHADSIYCAAFSPDGAFVVTAGYEGRPRVWNSISGKCISVLPRHSAPVLSASFSPDGSLLMTMGSVTLQIWNMFTRRLVDEKEGSAAAFSPDGSLLVTISDGNAGESARVWKVAENKCIGVYLLEGHLRGISSVAFSPDGSQVVTTGRDATALVWNVSTWHCVAEFGGQEGIVEGAAFSPDGNLIATYGGSHSVARLWKVPHGQARS